MPNLELPPPDVLIESGAVLIVNKPGGLLTQAPPGIDSLELRTKRWLIVRDNKPGKAYLAVPHRLDRPVSGIMVLAKNVRAARRISEQFQERTVTKIYWAVVEGVPDAAQGQWIDFMRKIPDEAKSEIVPANHPDAKKAILNFRVLHSADEKSLIQIELETGRTHQIRLQCGSRGHCILGDELYGSTAKFGPITRDIRKRWIALHSRKIGLTHPMEKTPLEATAPFSDHWDVFEEFREWIHGR